MRRPNQRQVRARRVSALMSRPPGHEAGNAVMSIVVARYLRRGRQARMLLPNYGPSCIRHAANERYVVRTYGEQGLERRNGEEAKR